MTKLSDLIADYASSPRRKGMLNEDITITVGKGQRARSVVVPKGTVSDLLIARTHGLYHFEANDVAFTATEREITLL